MFVVIMVALNALVAAKTIYDLKKIKPNSFKESGMSRSFIVRLLKGEPEAQHEEPVLTDVIKNLEPEQICTMMDVSGALKPSKAN